MKDRLCNKCLNNNNGWCKKLKTNRGLKDIKECPHFLNCEEETKTSDDSILVKLESMQKQLDEIQKIVTTIKNEMI